MKLKKRIMAIMLTLVYTCTIAPNSVIADDTVMVEDMVIYEKCDKVLETRISNNKNDKELPVYIWLKSKDITEVEKELQNRGYSCVNPLTGEIEKKEGYQEHKAEIICKNSETMLKEFVEKNIDKKKEVSIIPGADVIEVKLKPNDIKKIAKLEEVEEITYCSQYSAETECDIAQVQIRADWKNGTKSIKYNTGCGYTGDGVKVGIIELNGRYDETSPQLASIEGKRLFTLNTDGVISKTAVKSAHATAVTGILVGQAQNSMCAYEGVAPFSTVYQMPIEEDVSELMSGIMELALQGVEVINFSGRLDYSRAYNSIDKMLDKIIYQLGVVFVTTAGNNGLGSAVVGSPGKGYNIITVGNAETKLNATTVLSTSVFDIYKESAFIESDCNPNKPDLVAPGTHISFLLGDGKVHYDTGTSLAAPMVAGVVAQMMEANPALKGNPVAVKANLLLGADSDKMSGKNSNYLVGTTIQEKSGAGLVDALSAVNNAKGSEFKLINYDITNTLELCDKSVYRFYLQKGEKLRAVLCYDKPNDSYVDSMADNNNIILKLVDNSTGQTISYDNSANENVKIIEYTATKTGYYNLLTSAQSFSTEGIKSYNHILHCCVAWEVIK